MKSFFSFLALATLGLTFSLGCRAQAQTATVDWPSRNSKVICGGSVDGQDLNLHIVVPGELMGGESDNTRILIYIDLHKPGQVHWVLSDSLPDEEYDKREAILGRLNPEDAALFGKITATRVTELYMGFTEGLVQLNMNYADRRFSMSCQELPNTPLR